MRLMRAKIDCRKKDDNQYMACPIRFNPFSYLIYLINAFSSFITFSFNPMSVEVRTDSIEHFARELIFFPLFCVELKDTLIHKANTVLLMTIIIIMNQTWFSNKLP